MNRRRANNGTRRRSCGGGCKRSMAIGVAMSACGFTFGRGGGSSSARAEPGEWELLFREVLTTTKPGKLNWADPVHEAINGLAGLSGKGTSCGQRRNLFQGLCSFRGHPREGIRTRGSQILFRRRREHCPERRSRRGNIGRYWGY